MTGNGRCNFTNEYQKLECYHSYHEKESQFNCEVFEQISMEETVEFFKRIGIYPKSRNGYLYPASNQASSVAEVLEAEARFRKVKIKLNEQVLAIEKNEQSDTWLVKTKGWQYEAERIIITCGSPASLLEEDGWDGYTFAKSLGHQIVQCVCSKKFIREWSGKRCAGFYARFYDRRSRSIIKGTSGKL